MDELFYGIEVDVSEAGFYERLDEMKGIFEKEIPQTSFDELKTSEAIHKYCRVFRKFFDGVLGDGSADVIFKDVPDSIWKYNRILLKFYAFIEKQSNEIIEEKNSLIEKYKPE